MNGTVKKTTDGVCFGFLIANNKNVMLPIYLLVEEKDDMMMHLFCMEQNGTKTFTEKTNQVQTMEWSL